MGDHMSAKNLDSAMARMDPSGKNGVDFPKFAKWCGTTVCIVAAVGRGGGNAEASGGGA